MNTSESMEKEIFDRYVEIKLGNSEVCDDCIAKNPGLSDPVSFWFIGKDYPNANPKILFVGKNARGEVGEYYCNYKFRDARNAGKELWSNKSWPYWAYTKGIADNISKLNWIA